jgi:hypothetical protein
MGSGQRLAVLAARELPLDRDLRRRIEESLAAAEEAEAPPRDDSEGRRRAEAEDSGDAAGLELRGDGDAAAAGAGRGKAPAVRVARRGIFVACERLTVETDGRALLREIDLAVPAGQHVAILGRSGAGKSTPVRVVDRPEGTAEVIEDRGLSPLGWHALFSGLLVSPRVKVPGWRPQEGPRKWNKMDRLAL